MVTDREQLLSVYVVGCRLASFSSLEPYVRVLQEFVGLFSAWAGRTLAVCRLQIRDWYGDTLMIG